MRILMVAPRPPWPGFRGDQARTAGLATRLAARHELAIVAQRWPTFPVAQGPLPVETVDIGWPALGGRALAGGFATLFGAERPAQVQLFHHRGFRRAVELAIASFRPDVVWLVLSRLGDLLPLPGDLPVVVDLVDALGLNMAARAARSPLIAPFWRREAARLDAWDREVIHRATRATVVASRDRAHLLASAPGDAELAQKLRVLPFGLELPAAPAPSPAREGPPTLLLGGNLGYFPTLDGAYFLLEQVWPVLKARHPDWRLRLAGARPPASLRRAAKNAGAELIADPPDLRALTRQADVALAPLFAGSGTPIKILEAFADHVPVVATPKALAGLDELPPEAAASAYDAGTVVAAIENVFTDPDTARSRADNAYAWLRHRHDLDRVADQAEALLAEVVAGGRS